MRTVWADARLTKKQWRAALAAFDRLADDRARLIKMLYIEDHQTIKDQQALFLLRGQMLVACLPSEWEDK